jgi:hypothetical protein
VRPDGGSDGLTVQYAPAAKCRYPAMWLDAGPDRSSGLLVNVLDQDKEPRLPRDAEGAGVGAEPKRHRTGRLVISVVLAFTSTAGAGGVTDVGDGMQGSMKHSGGRHGSTRRWGSVAAGRRATGRDAAARPVGGGTRAEWWRRASPA